jgi:hypothetical protein
MSPCKFGTKFWQHCRNVPNFCKSYRAERVGVTSPPVKFLKAIRATVSSLFYLRIPCGRGAAWKIITPLIRF